MSLTRGELVDRLLEVDRTQKELEAAMARSASAAEIRAYYDRFLEALAAKKEAFEHEV